MGSAQVQGELWGRCAEVWSRTMEQQIRSTHPEVSAVFVKPQSVQDARERVSQTIITPDDVLREDVLTGG